MSQDHTGTSRRSVSELDTIFMSNALRIQQQGLNAFNRYFLVFYVWSQVQDFFLQHGTAWEIALTVNIIPLFISSSKG